MQLDAAQTDRAAGVMLALAAGDALGAPYEISPPLAVHLPVEMKGGGSIGWAPGEWTDDTAMAIPILEQAALGNDLRDWATLDRITTAWLGWAETSKDVGIQTRTVFSAARSKTSAGLTAAAEAHTRQNPNGASGNGSLMRIAPVALAYLDDAAGLTAAGTALSSLTHPHADAVEACVIWSLGIRHAVLNGNFDGVRLALTTLPADRAELWASRLDEAEQNPPAYFTKNGWVVQALQSAWSAITRTPIPAVNPARNESPADHLAHALEAAVRGGYDTDTVAAIAGGLLGACWGASAVPTGWRSLLNGWPGMDAAGLVSMAESATLHEAYQEAATEG
jgi:ADP-ribosyl-[dinitrogen reductase] hydrolase